MFVENFYKYCRYVMSHIAGSAYNSKWTNTGVKSISGDDINIYSSSFTNNQYGGRSSENLSLFYNTSVYFSNEITEPNYTDYALPAGDNDLLSKLSYSYTRNISYDSNRRKMRIRYTITGTCISNVPVDINQIYITKKVYTEYDGAYNTILLVKSSLKDKAIHLEKNDSFSFDYEIVL